LTSFITPPLLAESNNRIADVLRFERIAECRGAGFALGQRIEEIGDVIDEAVFVTDLQARHPVMVHVRMFAAGVGDVDAAPWLLACPRPCSRSIRGDGGRGGPT